MSKAIDYIDDLGLRDKITAYLQSDRKGDILLSDKEEQYMERIDYCDDVLRNYGGTFKELVGMVCEKYTIGPVHAKKLLQDAKYIHGSMNKPVRNYDRMRLTEILWEIVLKKKGMEPEVAMKGIELIMKLNRLDDTTLDVDATEDTGARVTIIKPVFDPGMLGTAIPENIDDIVKKLRGQTALHKKKVEEVD